MSALRFFDKAGAKMAPAEFVAKLKGTSQSEAETHLEFLLQDARTTELGIESLILSKVDQTKVDDRFKGLDAVEAVFAEMGVPLSRRNERSSAQLAASSDIFISGGGLKVLLPLLMDNLVREADSRVILENVEDLLAVTRQVPGAELITEVLYDKDSEDAYDSFRVAEGTKIPTRTLKATRSSVEFWKYGSAMEVTYEASRRISPDMLIPYVNRQKLERTQAEARSAVEILIEGDGVAAPAAPTIAITDPALGGVAGRGLQGNARAFQKWLVNAARSGYPIDTLVVGYDSLFELGFMFPDYQETTNGGVIVSQGVQNTIGSTFGMGFRLPAGLSLAINVVVSSQIPENSILGFRKGETLQRLIETGSQISEFERTIKTQTMFYTNTINMGFTFGHHKSRQILTW